jgi:hypothetical protein
MKCRFTCLSIAAAVGAALALAGCTPTTTPPPSTGTTEHKEGDGHDHAAEHAHPAEGPHHGHLIELGNDDYHAELAHDDATKTVTIYLLGKDAKTAVTIPDPEILLNLVVDGKPLQAKLTASPQEGDPAGQSSRFSIIDETILEAHDAPKTTGRLSVTINGTPYSGTVEHHEHGEHKH